MTYQFRRAVRENVPLLIGLAGGTGSGKTYSLLELAKGMTPAGKRFAFIDTEAGQTCTTSETRISWGSGWKHRGNYDYARSICAICPVQRDCLEWAIGAGEDQGLWGGKSPDQRRRLARVRTGP